jgi:hypothetical protein
MPNPTSAVGYIQFKNFVFWERCRAYSGLQRITFHTNTVESKSGRTTGFRIYFFNFEELFKVAEFAHESDMAAIIVNMPYC